MAAITPSVSLWVKAEPFNYGALPVPPHPRLTVNNIKRIVTYAKNKGKQGFPKLSYPVWKHIAVKKLELPMDLAWMYFVTFDLVSGESVPEQRLEWDRRFFKCMSQQELELIRSQMAVPTLKFVLFLYIQQLHRISLRASLVSGSDEWPMRSRSPTTDLDSRTTATGGKGLDEQGHLTFMLNNLNEVMELLVEPDSYASGGDASDLALSIEGVEALGFLIAGSVDRNRTIKPLQDIALMQQMHQKSGYSKVNVETSRSPRGLKLVISRSFSYRSLQSWLRSHLGANPFGISNCIANGRRLSWPLAGEDKERLELKRGRIATNALFVPKEYTKGNKIILMSQVCKQTIARSSGTLESSSMKVHRCHYSFIYLLSPLRSVSVEKCRHSTIVLGAVETTVHVNHCEHCIIITACRRISISGSSNCTLHLLTPNRPLVFSGNSNLVLAPYHTYYPKLEQHMDAVGIGPELNVWDRPLPIGPDHHEDNPVWELLSPKNFCLFSIPFEMEGTTKDMPGNIPAKYQKSLAMREEQMVKWQKIVKDAGLTKDQRRQLQTFVEQSFQEWMEREGFKRELDGLAVTASTLSAAAARKASKSDTS